MILKIVLAILLAISSMATEKASSQEVSFFQQLIAETPDIVSEYEDEGVVSFLEAYQNLQDSTNINRSSEWFSIGRPKLVSAKNASLSLVLSKDVFVMTHQGFYLHIDMLTDSQKIFIAQRLSIKFQNQVNKSQILKIVPDTLECNIDIFCNPNDEQPTSFKGAATYLKQFPIRVSFNAPLKSDKRRCFETNLIENQEIEIKCSLSKRSSLPVYKYLTITADDLARSNIVERVFGSESSVLINPIQFDLLVSQLYGLVVAGGEFNLTEDQFKDEMLRSNAFSDTKFEYISFGQALESLSTLGFGNNSLSIEEIEAEFKLVDFNQVNSMTTRRLDDSTTNSSSYFKILGGLKSRNYANKNRLFRNSYNLYHEVEVLNGLVRSLIKWKQESYTIVPESLNVTRLRRSLFSSGLVLENVYKKISEKESVFKNEFLIRTQGNPEESYTIVPDMYVNTSFVTQIRSIHNAMDPWSQCFKACNQHPSCHFVEFKSTNSCVLFDKSAHFATLDSSSDPTASSSKVLFHRKKYQKKYAEGVVLTGSFIKSFHENQSSEDTCWDECLLLKNCVSVSFNMSDSSCYLYKKGSYKVLADSEFLSVGFESERIGQEKTKQEVSEIIEERKPVQDAHVYWFVQLGNSGWAKNSQEQSHDECWQKCLNEPGCVAITYHTTSFTCSMFEVETYTVQLDREYVSIALNSHHAFVKSKIQCGRGRGFG